MNDNKANKMTPVTLEETVVNLDDRSNGLGEIASYSAAIKRSLYGLLAPPSEPVASKSQIQETVPMTIPQRIQNHNETILYNHDMIMSNLREIKEIIGIRED